MKVAVISFYESNARYYHFLEKRLKKKDSRNKIVQLCLYPSAVKYCKKNNLEFIYLTKEVRKVSHKININIDKFLNYHFKILPNYVNQINKIGAQYYNFFKKFFYEQKIDVFISIGDERLFASIPAYIAKKHGVKVLYFEPGPFSTMIFDKKGVNCRMEISSLNEEELKNVTVDKKVLSEFFDTTVSKVKFYDMDKSAYLRKLGDIFYSVPPKLLKKILPIELQTGEYFIESIKYLKKRLFSNKKSIEKQSSRKYGKFLFVALQVPTDVQMIVHSPIYSNFYDMLVDIYYATPKGYNIVIREHPMNIGRYESKIYEFIQNNNDIFIDNDTPINELIAESELVIINNSTVGVEALRYGKTVIATGKTYYSPVVYNVKKRDELASVILKGLSTKIPKELIDKYLYLLYDKYLIKDHYKNYEYKNLDKVIFLLEKVIES